MFGTSRHSRSLLKIIQKYLQAWQTFWSFNIFWKIFRSSRHSRRILEVIQKYLQGWKIILSFYNFLKNVKKLHALQESLWSHKKLLKTWETFWSIDNFWKIFRCLRHSWSLLEEIQKYFKLDRHSGASTISEKCLGAPGTPGVF